MKQFILNRANKRICVVVEKTPKPKGLAFVMHGLGGYKDQAHIRTICKAFLAAGYTVVSFDTTNTFGESDGNYEDATVTNYYADLEDVIAWAKTQSWFTKPFVLAGHSLGGLCTALYAEKRPDTVKGLAPISTVVSGALSLETYKLFDELEQLTKWKKAGIQITKSFDGKRVKRLKYSHMEDRLRYDLLPDAARLTMPVLMIVGERDDSTPPVHQQILFDALPSKKEIHIINGAPHTFHEAPELAELNRLFTRWLNSLG